MIDRLLVKILFVVVLFASVGQASSLSRFRFSIKEIMLDSTRAFHTDANIDSATNRSINYVTAACSCVVEKDSFNTVAETKEYKLHRNFSAIKAVYNADKKTALYQIDVKDLGKIPTTTVQTNPSKFYIWGRRPSDTLYYMGTDPTPVDAQKIWYWYFVRAKRLLASDSTTNLPDEFYTAIIYRAMKELYAREHEYEKAEYWGMQADKEIALGRLRKATPVDQMVEFPKVIKQ